MAVGTWLMSLARFTAPAAAGRDAGEEDCPPALMQVRLDGKAIRGATEADGNQVRLLAALAGPDAASSVVAAQAEVGKKANEVPMATVVLGQIDLNDKIVTADALHTVKATTSHIHDHGGEFVLPVKENRRALSGALDALPWGQVPIARTATDKGHGRITTRTIQVMAAPEDLPFPHVSQVFLIERHVTDLRGQPISAVAALGDASPAADQASPADLAGYVREQWTIESLHWTRHPVPRGQIQGQNPKWPQGHGCSPRRRPAGLPGRQAGCPGCSRPCRRARPGGQYDRSFGSVSGGRTRRRRSAQETGRSAAPALLPIFRSRLQADILAALLLNPEDEYTLTELAERFNAPASTVHGEVKRLTDAGLIRRRELGRSAIVRADTSNRLMKPLAELLLLSWGPLQVVAEEFSELDGAEQVLIFGSWAARYHQRPG